ncbi:hypothetical protein BDZ97DRAFT_2046038 [Flammula alnicola]|nr:hypothetical protein BDZ97DRAFT_2046038 [Flammula alnicola]
MSFINGLTLPTTKALKADFEAGICDTDYTRSTTSISSSWAAADLQHDRGRIPPPSHRHASPSAPWPWADLEDAVNHDRLETKVDPVPPSCDHASCDGGCWKNYPQSRFPNWTRAQVKKSRIQKAIEEYSKDAPCLIHQVEVDNDGLFSSLPPVVANHGQEDAIWSGLIQKKKPDNSRVQALFIENISGPILQMLGAKYNIEPFFWSSSLNWIPSRFQEEVKPRSGDHITITLTYLRSVKSDGRITETEPSYYHQEPNCGPPKDCDQHSHVSLKIDTQAPLSLSSKKRMLVLDLLAVHLVRNVDGGTIISYHPTGSGGPTTAEFLHDRVRFAGTYVYWQSIFKNFSDPTFVLLTFLWHAMYGWDEALEHLYDHICSLETQIVATAKTSLTHELHIIRAHHLHYSSLLDDVAKHVTFIQETVNPALERLPEEYKKANQTIMDRECANLLAEVKRLQGELTMQERRLKNVNDLVFSSVNITDSRYMRQMTETAVRDSAAMKQIAYLTMFFLPASFVAGVFGMNVSEINPGTLGTLAHYLAAALSLTMVTVWIIIAFQSGYIFRKKTGFFKRLGWPFYLTIESVEYWKTRHQREANKKKREREQDYV